MLRVDGPAVIAYCNIEAAFFNRLDIAGVAGPANGLQVVQVKKQIKVALVRGDVVDDCGPWVASAALEWDAAAFVLALE